MEEPIGIKPTKKFLLAQIEAFKLSIYESKGAIMLCEKMISAGCFVSDGDEIEEK